MKKDIDEVIREIVEEPTRFEKTYVISYKTQKMQCHTTIEANCVEEALGKIDVVEIFVVTNIFSEKNVW